VNKHTVDLHLAVCHHLLDLPLLLQVLEALACERAVDLESVDESGDGNEAVGLDVLVELVGSGLVKEDSVLRLVLDCKCEQKTAGSVYHRRNQSPRGAENLTLSLGPLLLLLLRASRCGSHFGWYVMGELGVEVEIGGRSLAAKGGEIFLMALLAQRPQTPSTKA